MKQKTKTIISSSISTLCLIIIGIVLWSLFNATDKIPCTQFQCEIYKEHEMCLIKIINENVQPCIYSDCSVNKTVGCNLDEDEQCPHLYCYKEDSIVPLILLVATGLIILIILYAYIIRHFNIYHVCLGVSIIMSMFCFTISVIVFIITPSPISIPCSMECYVNDQCRLYNNNSVTCGDIVDCSRIGDTIPCGEEYDCLTENCSPNSVYVNFFIFGIGMFMAFGFFVCCCVYSYFYSHNEDSEVKQSNENNLKQPSEIDHLIPHPPDTPYHSENEDYKDSYFHKYPELDGDFNYELEKIN